ncbi:MAG: hypothetical protein V3U43_04785 [Pseudomonadales bacterium]
MYDGTRRLCVMVVLTLITVSFEVGAASRYDGHTPPTLQRERASDCIGFYRTTDGATQLLINSCKRTVYVSVIEHGAMTVHPRCAVFGLQGHRYGKAYGPGESYLKYSLSASFDSDKALNACERSGYEVHGGGIGEFIVVTKRRCKS